MLTPSEIWPMIAGSAVVVYGAGHIVGGIVAKNHEELYVKKEVCSAVHLANTEHIKRIDKNLNRIWRLMNGQPLERGDDEDEI
jgi:hypothetical protein